MPALSKLRANIWGVESEFEITTTPRLQWRIREIVRPENELHHNSLGRVTVRDYRSGGALFVLVYAQITGIYSNESL